MADEANLSERIWTALGKIHFIFWILEVLGVGTLILTASEEIRHHLSLLVVMIVDLVALFLIVAGIVFCLLRERHKSSTAVKSLVQSPVLGVKELILNDKTYPKSKTYNAEALGFLFPLTVTLIGVSPDDSIDPKIVYKSKIRIVLQNDSKQPLDIEGAFWIADGNIDLQLPSRLKFRTEIDKGVWSKDKCAGVYVPCWSKVLYLDRNIEKNFANKDFSKRTLGP